MPAESLAISTPDLCVIGGGTAGYAVATAAGALGVPTTLIDKEALASALPRAGDIAWDVLVKAARAKRRPNGPDGGRDRLTGNDWAELLAAARAAAEAFAPDMSARRLRALGVEVLSGVARFRDKRTLEVGLRAIRARRFVIATGTSPALPAVSGLDVVPFLTARALLDLPALPRRLIIVGGGRTGIEAAQVFRRLGSEVALVETGPLLAAFDGDLRQTVLARLAAEGVRLYDHATALRVEGTNTGLRLMFTPVRENQATGEGSLEGSHLLIAAGWVPNIAEWHPDKAEVACSAQGVIVRPNGGTGNARIFAVGDVTGLGRSMASAQAQAGVVLRAALFRQPVRFDPKLVPKMLRTDPPIASVGHSEAQARRRFGRIRILRWPYRDNERARAEGLTTGHLKVVTTRSGQVVGAGIVGAEAGELVGLWALAIRAGLRASEVAAVSFPVPSFGDLSRRTALSAAFADLDNPWIERTLRLIRRLG